MAIILIKWEYSAYLKQNCISSVKDNEWIDSKVWQVQLIWRWWPSTRVNQEQDGISISHFRELFSFSFKYRPQGSNTQGAPWANWLTRLAEIESSTFKWETQPQYRDREQWRKTPNTNLWLPHTRTHVHTHLWTHKQHTHTQNKVQWLER